MFAVRPTRPQYVSVPPHNAAHTKPSTPFHYRPTPLRPTTYCLLQVYRSAGALNYYAYILLAASIFWPYKLCFKKRKKLCVQASGLFFPHRYIRLRNPPEGKPTRTNFRTFHLYPLLAPAQTLHTHTHPPTHRGQKSTLNLR